MLKKFFYENPNLDNRIQRVTRVSDVNTSYYDSNDQKISNQKRTEFLRTIIANVKRKKTNLSNFETIILKNILHEPLMLTQYTDNSMRGACIPGSYKLSVDVDGAFHMCEKINPNYSIGSVYDGIDEDAQLDVMSNFFKEINKKCKNCNIKNLCNICYVSAETEKESFNISLEYCQKMREGVLSSLSEYYSLLESNPDLFMDLRR
ncbi:SPASM domain-containing protein [Enterococcus diestrammenae]|uniref:Radical SAM protein n=1 Tax=Enterococcus diestrammenae TaxID=1155073 RepID=A0ABV0F2W2_9ENTE